MTDSEFARQQIEEMKLMEALRGDDEDAEQFRNVVTAARSIINELGEERQRLSETGHYTEEGLVEAMKDAATAAQEKLNHLQSKVVAPRFNNIVTKLENLPTPTVGKELSEMERHRIITSYLQAPAEKKSQMRAEAIKNPKLASALLAEDRSVTGLTPNYLNELRTRITSDPHQKERSTLQTKMNAARAAKTALEGAATTIRRSVEPAQ